MNTTYFWISKNHHITINNFCLHWNKKITKLNNTTPQSTRYHTILWVCTIFISPHLKFRYRIQSRKIFNVSSMDVKTCTMPWTTHTTIHQATFYQWSTIMGAFMTNCCISTILANQQSMSTIANINLTHSKNLSLQLLHWTVDSIDHWICQCVCFITSKF